MHALAHGAVGHEGPGAPDIGAGQAQGVRRGRGVEPHHAGRRRGGAEGAVDARGVPASQRHRVIGGGVGETRAHLVPGHEPQQHGTPVRARKLRGPHGGRHLAGARVSAAADVVELAQMRVGAVEKCGGLRRHPARHAPDRARARAAEVIPDSSQQLGFGRGRALERAAEGVEETPPRHPHHLVGQPFEAEGGDPASEGLGQRGSGRAATCRHSPTPRPSARAPRGS